MVLSDITVGVALPDLLLCVGLFSQLQKGDCTNCWARSFHMARLLYCGCMSLGVVALVGGSKVLILSVLLCMVMVLCFTTLHATGEGLDNSGSDDVPE